MKKPKFDVGDVLKPVLDDTCKIKFHVIEVLTQKCPAGIEQVKYLGRFHTTQFHGDPASITRNLFEVNEIEVEKWSPKGNDQKSA